MAHPAPELSIAEHVRAADLVAYQAGAVVSRILLKRPTGTVTIFAFDEGQGLSEHTAPFDALVEIVEGEADIVVDDAPQRVTAGEIVLLPAHHPHAVHAPARFKMLLTMIRSA